MPLFYFDLFDGKNDIDREGTELEDLEEARFQAVSAMGGLLSDCDRNTLPMTLVMTVKDEVGKVIYTIKFTIKTNNSEVS